MKRRKSRCLIRAGHPGEHLYGLTTRDAPVTVECGAIRPRKESQQAALLRMLRESLVSLVVHKEMEG